jgi:hypothetical protein
MLHGKRPDMQPLGQAPACVGEDDPFKRADQCFLDSLDGATQNEKGPAFRQAFPVFTMPVRAKDYSFSA